MKIISLLICWLVISAGAFAQNSDTNFEREIKELNQEISQFAGQKKFAEAVPSAQKVVELAKSNFGETHTEYAKALQTLGYLYFVIEKNDEAEAALETTLKIYEGKSDAEDLQIGVLETLASLKYKDNDHKKAIKLLERVVELREQSKNQDPGKLMASLWSLANLNYSVQQFDKSAEIYRRVFDLRRTQNAVNDSELLDAYTRTFCSLNKADKGKEATNFETAFFDEVFRNRNVKNIDFLKVKALDLPPPQYPAVAGKLKKGGQVKVLAVIDEKGNVTFSCAKTNQYYFGFVNAAEKAAYRAKFSPVVINGEPVKAITTITYNFSRE